jgi:AraC-like DNA-binding protein
MLELESPYNTNLSIESVIKLCGFESNENFVKYVKEKHENFTK